MLKFVWFCHAHKHLIDFHTLFASGFLCVRSWLETWNFQGFEFWYLLGVKGGWRKIDRYLSGFVMKVSNGHPYYLYIERPPVVSTVIFHHQISYKNNKAYECARRRFMIQCFGCIVMSRGRPIECQIQGPWNHSFFREDWLNRVICRRGNYYHWNRTNITIF